ncbi:MAG TPA: hypothetical protein VJ841_01190 [Candidatus Saccharimonadales bacterium]|nr:hypothetical protein [Candidatus Saccharimonadales bacterium]
MKKVFAAAALGGVFLLSACSLGRDVDPFNLANGANVGTVACDKVVDTSNAISRADNTLHGRERDDALRSWGISPDKLNEVHKALDERSKECHGEASPSSTPSASPSASSNNSTLVGTGLPIAGECPANFVQKFDPNEKGNFSSDGIKNSADVISLLGHDARYLAFVGHIVLPNEVDGKVESLLPEGKNDCLSRKGAAVYDSVVDELKNAKVDEDATAPADGYNTGMQGNHGVVDADKGVGGKRDSVRFTFENKNSLDVMKRCGNPVIHGQGDLPKGETDHQRPPKETPTGLSPKNPHLIPGNGGAGDGGSSKYGGTGSDRQTADPHASSPAAGNPPSRYTPPAPPKDTSPPRGSTPTRGSTPAPEPSVNPTGGSGNTGDPGGW